MLVKDLMTVNPITVPPEEDVYYGFYLIKKHNIRQLPVVSNEGLIGIVTERDLRMLIEKPPVKIKSVMSTNLYTVTEDTTVESAANLIKARKINALPVVNDENTLVGIITVNDILGGILELMNANSKSSETSPSH
jgi:acetoin utilization protein AcuB